MYEHAFTSAAKPWPLPDGKTFSSSSTMVTLFTEFGSLELHILTLNIESITNDLTTILAFREIPRLHVTFHVAMGRRYGQMLDIQPADDGAYPVWFDFSMIELADTLKELNENPGLILNTNLRKWVYAATTLRANKVLKHRSRLDTQHFVPLSESALRETSAELAPGNPDSREGKTQHRNATTKDWIDDDDSEESKDSSDDGYLSEPPVEYLVEPLSPILEGFDEQLEDSPPQSPSVSPSVTPSRAPIKAEASGSRGAVKAKASSSRAPANSPKPFSRIARRTRKSSEAP
jgi:hypothetical protein